MEFLNLKVERKMMNKLILLLAVLLSGCSSSKPDLDLVDSAWELGCVQSAAHIYHLKASTRRERMDGYDYCQEHRTDIEQVIR